MPVILPKGTGDKKKRKRSMLPVRPSRSVRKRFTDFLVREVDLLKAMTANLSDLIRSGASRARAAERLEQMSMQSIERMRVVAPRAAAAFVNDADKAQKKQMESNLSRALGTDFATILDTPSTAADIDLAVGWNTSLIKSIPAKHLDLVGQAVLDNYRGAPLPDGVSLTRRLMDIGNISENRARFIARDQTSKLTSALNKSRQQSNGIEEYTWQNVGDARVVGNPAGKYPKGSDGHENHWDREGKTFGWDRPPADGHPGEAYNCFPGSAELDLSNGCHHFWRHKFSGVLACVRTVEGARLEATPNHPILTLRGWVPIGALQEGDHLIQASRDGRFVKELDVDHTVATFDQCFDFLSVAAVGSTAARSEFNFHGDVPQHDVDVVEVTPDLFTRLKAHLAKRGDEFKLAAPAIDLARPGLDGGGAREVGFGDESSGACDPGAQRQHGAIFCAQFLQAIEIGFGARAEMDVSTPQNATDRATLQAEIARDVQDALPAKVHGLDAWFVNVRGAVWCWPTRPTIGDNAPSAEVLAQIVRMNPKANAYVFEGHSLVYKPQRVVEKSSREFSGHVYNLQTKTGWYGAEGIVSHNCRCSALPVLDLDKLDAMYP